MARCPSDHGGQGGTVPPARAFFPRIEKAGACRESQLQPTGFPMRLNSVRYPVFSAVNERTGTSILLFGYVAHEKDFEDFMPALDPKKILLVPLGHAMFIDRKNLYGWKKIDCVKHA